MRDRCVLSVNTNPSDRLTSVYTLRTCKVEVKGETKVIGTNVVKICQEIQSQKVIRETSTLNMNTKCHSCGKDVKPDNNLSSHMNTHLCWNRFECVLCGKCTRTNFIILYTDERSTCDAGLLP